MDVDQFRCVKTLAESLDLKPAELIAIASQVAEHPVSVITDLNYDQADVLIDILAARELPRKSVASEQPTQAKKERA